jgi:hypothetical protein
MGKAKQVSSTLFSADEYIGCALKWMWWDEVLFQFRIEVEKALSTSQTVCLVLDLYCNSLGQP